jgi:DNA-binding NarL/FixJ family response regulator
VTARLRVFLIAAAPGDLNALRARIEATGDVEVVGTAVVEEGRLESARPPDDVDAIIVSPASWPRAPSTTHGPESDENRLIEALTGRERDVLALLADGRGNREIAARLGISEHTVKFHLASLFGKLRVSTRTQAVRRALDWGLIEI